MKEPNIVINGNVLTDGQAMTLRVALTSFLQEMQEPGALGTDEAGERLAAAYVEAASAIVRQMHAVWKDGRAHNLRSDLLEALEAMVEATMYKDHPAASQMAIDAIARARGTSR